MNKSTIIISDAQGNIECEKVVNAIDIATGIPSTILESMTPAGFDSSNQWVHIDGVRVQIGSQVDIEWSADPIATFDRRGDEFEVWRIYKKLEDSYSAYDFYREVEGGVTIEWDIDKISLISIINQYIADEEEIQYESTDSDGDNCGDWTNYNLMNDCLDDLEDN